MYKVKPAINVFILSSFLHFNLPNDLFSTGLPTTILYAS